MAIMILVVSLFLLTDLTSATFFKKDYVSYSPVAYEDAAASYPAPPQTYSADSAAEVKPPAPYVPPPASTYNSPPYPPKSGYNYNQPIAPTYESRPTYSTYNYNQPQTYEARPTYTSYPQTNYQQSGAYGLPQQPVQRPYPASYLTPDKPGPWNMFSFFQLPKFGIFNKDNYPQPQTYTAYNNNPAPYGVKPVNNYQQMPNSYQISSYPANNYYSNQGIYQVPPPKYPVMPKYNYPTTQPPYNPNYTAVTTPAPYTKPTPAPPTSNYAPPSPPQSYSIYLVPAKAVYPQQSYNPGAYQEQVTSYRQQPASPPNNSNYNVALRPYRLDGAGAGVNQDGYAKDYLNQYPYGANSPTPSVTTYETTPKPNCQTTTYGTTPRSECPNASNTPPPTTYTAAPTVPPTTAPNYVTEAYSVTSDESPQPSTSNSSGKPAEARLLELFSNPNGTDGWRPVQSQK